MDGCPGQKAKWLKKLWTPQTYARKHPARHVLSRVVLGVTANTYVPDIMHNKSLGAVGSLLRYLTHYFLDETPMENLSRLLDGDSNRIQRSTIELPIYTSYPKHDPPSIKKVATP